MIVSFDRPPRLRDFLRFLGVIWLIVLSLHVILFVVQVGAFGRPAMGQLREQLGSVHPVSGIVSVMLWGLIFWAHRAPPGESPPEQGEGQE